LLRFAIGALASSLLAVLMIRMLYTVPAGIQIVDMIPDGFWTRYHRLFGLADVGNVERVQDADALVLWLFCLVPATVLVIVVAALVRRRFE
jgi:hypothetical protein